MASSSLKEFWIMFVQHPQCGSRGLAMLLPSSHERVLIFCIWADMSKKLYFSSSPKKNDTRTQKWESWWHSYVTILWDQISIKQCTYCNHRCCVCCCTMLLEPISWKCKSLIMSVYSVCMYRLWISTHNHNCPLQEMTWPNNGCATSAPNYNISITQ